MRKSRWSPTAVALALVLGSAAACAPKPNYLFVEPRDGTVRVELRKTAGLFARREYPLPLDDCGFFAGPDPEAPETPPQEIWRVLSLAPDRMTLSIRYGQVPEGFTQVTPPRAAPPPLEAGESYVVECAGDAIGVTEFRMPE